MSILLALSPILLLIVLMVGFKVRGDWSAVAALLTAVVVAIFAMPALGAFPMEKFLAMDSGLSPQLVTLWAIAEGAFKAVFPILIIIMMAIYSYNVLLESKQIEVIKEQFTSISSDRRIQVLLIIWGFGGLLEGMAGFGTAVAIPAAILIGLGFKPMFSALVALIGNSVATGFGAVGVPVITLVKEAHFDAAEELMPQLTKIVSADVIIQLTVLMFLIPFIILYLTDTSKKYIVPNIILTLIVGGISLATQFCAAYFLGAETPAIIGSIACIVFLVLYARFTERGERKALPYTGGQLLKAWAVYGFILLFILLASSKVLAGIWVWEFSYPISAKSLKFDVINNAGTMLFFGAFLGGLVQGVSVSRLFAVFGQTVLKLNKSAVTIISLVAMSSVMSHSGMITTIADALVAATGTLYPLFAPLVGSIGTFATGSDTSSNILFGKLQANVADQLGIDKSWLAAANTAGATGGKIISPQSIAIATAACDMQGQEGSILRLALPYALFYVLIAGITVYCFAGWALG